MALRALFGSRASTHGSSQSLNGLEEIQALEEATRAVTLIMNDDVDGAESGLAKGNSPFHQLGTALVLFNRAVLGFEPEIMREASEKLNNSENVAYEYQRKAQRQTDGHQASSYSPGSEYALCQAESQLMGAVVAVLNESLTESIKGFYKLRKAYILLDALLEEEKKIIAEKTSSGSSKISSARPSTDSKRTPKPQPPDVSGLSLEPEASSEEKTGEKSVDATENLAKADISEKETALGLDGTVLSKAVKAESIDTITDPNAALFEGNPIDMFIHSGSNMCFGILQLLLSMVPPAFASLLRIIGFRGDRVRGCDLLWSASHYDNINGAMAGLVLLGFYNGMSVFCDILPVTGEGAVPTERCKKLLASMIAKFPESRLWRLENARMMAAEKRLDEALVVLKEDKESPMKQVEALRWFERSIISICVHDFEGGAFAFQKMVRLNNWSHGLYYYIAGSAHVELYRENKKIDPTVAKEHAEKAEELLKLATKNTGKKMFMARQLPFDSFVNRKVEKWTSRAESWGVDFVDAVGVSPIEEMIYFWNGYKRMSDNHLEKSLERLNWSTTDANPLWEKESLDEHAILAMLRSSTLRGLGRTTEAREVLQSEILCHDATKFTGQHKDNWTAPCAHYEMAVIAWTECAGNMEDKEKLAECSEWLEKVAKWGAFELDARIGLRVATARDTLRKCGFGPGA